MVIGAVRIICHKKNVCFHTVATFFKDMWKRCLFNVLYKDKLKDLYSINCRRRE